MAIEEIKNVKIIDKNSEDVMFGDIFSDDELRGDFSKLCEFDRLKYLQMQEYFEEGKAAYYHELDEFDYEPVKLVQTLAYTRHRLAKAELIIKEMLTTIKIEKNKSGKIIEDDLEITYSINELAGDFSKSDKFNRLKYILEQEGFEEVDYYAFKLAYTRYLLTKAELLIKEMLTKQAEKGEKGETIWQ